MGYLRVAYRGTLRPYRDSDAEVPIQWYFVPPTNPVFTLPNVFGSRLWERPRSKCQPTPPDAGPGETLGPITFWKGVVAGAPDGSHFCGTPEQWLRGASVDDPRPAIDPATGQPVCCPRPRIPSRLAAGGTVDSGLSLLSRFYSPWTNGGTMDGGDSEVCACTLYSGVGLFYDFPSPPGLFQVEDTLAIPFQASLWDTDAYHTFLDQTKITVPSTAVYRCTVNMQLLGGSIAYPSRWFIRWRRGVVGDVAFTTMIHFSVNATADPGVRWLSWTVDMSLSAGEQIELWVEKLDAPSGAKLGVSYPSSYIGSGQAAVTVNRLYVLPEE